MPCYYVRVVPLANWKPALPTFSIARIRLFGETDRQRVAEARTLYAQHIDREATRLCLKFLRESRYEGALEALQAQSQVPLEDVFLHDLRHLLVDQGDFEAVERLLDRSVHEGHFTDYVRQCHYAPSWTRCPTSPTNGQSAFSFSFFLSFFSFFSPLSFSLLI